MFNEIKMWLLRKGIWFLLILLGFIAYANLQPEWDKAAEAANAIEAQGSFLKKTGSMEEKSVEAVSKAKQKKDSFLKERIDDKNREIEDVAKKIRSLTTYKINDLIERNYLDYKLVLAHWELNQYTALSKLRLDESTRPQQIAEKQAALQEMEVAYQQKLSNRSRFVNGANKLISWTDFEFKDPNVSNTDLANHNGQILQLRSELQALLNPKAHQSTLPPSMDTYAAQIDLLVKGTQADLKKSGINTHIIQPAVQYWPFALLAVVLGITFSPLSRFLCFYFLAPIATRQRPITLEPNSGPGSETKECSTSGTNIELGLEPSDVLLVHHDYAKAIPNNCRASTQILLDKSSPFTSLASGLYNLVRIEPIETTAVDISSGHDGLNELMTIRIETGESIVIEPRNIVGIVIRQGKLITLRKHWVFNKLQPWLKWQFRYITISGPLTLVLKGGRGLVVSQIHNELLIEPEYVVAFSSSIGYGTSRTETFGGYYSRKKSLLKDHFFGSHGFVIHQEANLDSTMSSKKSGLEGALDGLLKAFGI